MSNRRSLLFTNRPDYAQALAFDQLHNLMQNGQAFDGFREGPINFAPTFKYDVLRILKRSKTKGSRHRRKPDTQKNRSLSEVEKPAGDAEDAEEEERASLASSVWTSVHSKSLIDPDDSDLFVNSQSQVSNMSHKIRIAAAAHKAKRTCMALLSPSTTPSTTASRYRKSGFSTKSLVTSTTPPLPKVVSPETENNSPSRPLGPVRTTSTKSTAQNGDEETDDDDKGVYNSFRVPSWCVLMNGT